ncbi:MBL fold metallo-hydrolase [Streptomyces sp. NPDC002143]
MTAVDKMERWTVGSLEITKFVEFGGRATLEAAFAAPPNIVGATLEIVSGMEWLRPEFMDSEGTIGSGVHSYLIGIGSERLIVDTGVGNHKARAASIFNGLNTDWLERLEKIGWAPETVTGVINTHLHVDHSGWNTRLIDGRWVPTFPNATYYFVENEFKHWQRFAGNPDAGEEYTSEWAREMVDGIAVYRDSVEPVWDAGLVRLVEADQQITPSVRLVPSPGHTPGHSCVLVESDGESAIMIGDMMHSIYQVGRPDWSSVLDTDMEAARRTRQDFVERWADTGTLVLGAHWAEPAGGYLTRDGESYRMTLKR